MAVLDEDGIEPLLDTSLLHLPLAPLPLVPLQLRLLRYYQLLSRTHLLEPICRLSLRWVILDVRFEKNFGYFLGGI